MHGESIALRATPDGGVRGYMRRVCVGADASSGLGHLLTDPQLLLDLLEGHALGLRDHGLYPDELENHHPGEEREYVTGRQSSDHLGEKRGERRRENPVSEAAQSLSFGAVAVGEYL